MKKKEPTFPQARCPARPRGRAGPQQGSPLRRVYNCVFVSSVFELFTNVQEIRIAKYSEHTYCLYKNKNINFVMMVGEIFAWYYYVSCKKCVFSVGNALTTFSVQARFAEEETRVRFLGGG